MTVTSPTTALRERLVAALNVEFAADSIVFGNDKLNASLGQNGPIGAVYPGEDAERVGQIAVITVTAYVQLFLQWKAVVDPKQVVDPSAIEILAERVRRACQADDIAGPNDAHLWYYRVSRIEYPPDPTGNISRLVATVTADAQNPALIDTVG